MWYKNKWYPTFHSIMSTQAVMSAVQKISISITSDTICPWCWFAYRHIQDAISQAKAKNISAQFEIKFEPFQLDSNLPPSPGYNKRSWYASRLGAHAIKAAEVQMLQVGRAEGVSLNYDGQVSNTLDSHRLLEKARQIGGEQGQLKVAEALFEAYFVRAEDIGSSEVLSNGAAVSGVMSKQEALTFLKSQELAPEVQKGLNSARSSRVSGVPHIVINDRRPLSGAQPASAFLSIFNDIARSQNRNEL